jgi:hypothetical protein
VLSSRSGLCGLSGCWSVEIWESDLASKLYLAGSGVV